MAKTVGGVTTDYVLDGSTGLTTGPAAGLTQVLQETTDGQATAYLYGHDLLAQYDSGTWAYHVNDGLGSVRQLVDPTGQVVQSHSFSPFGVPLGESGGEPYGFTGEQWDASAGLVFLRARYYQPGMGRFVSRDPFPGFDTSPQTLNAYQYVTNNAINLVDPSGRIPNEPEIIEGRFTYSCNCGWIDWAHADPGRVLRILEIVDAAIAWQGDIPHRAYYRHPFPVPGIGPVETAGPLRFNPNLTSEDRLAVALGIYQESEERFESFWSSRYSRLANVLPPIGERPSSWGPIQHRFSDTYFTEEDLPSDLIGFYRAIDSEDLLPEGVPPDEWESKMLLADICGFPKNEDKAVRWSRFVYSGQREAGMGWERISEWGKVRLVTDWDPEGCENTSWAGVLRNSVRYTCRHAWGYSCQWPSEFNRISPERSKLYDGKWWWVEDEELEYVGL